jgi:hypothetical protein
MGNYLILKTRGKNTVASVVGTSFGRLDGVAGNELLCRVPRKSPVVFYERINELVGRVDVA